MAERRASGTPDVALEGARGRGAASEALEGARCAANEASESARGQGVSDEAAPLDTQRSVADGAGRRVRPEQRSVADGAGQQVRLKQRSGADGAGRRVRSTQSGFLLRDATHALALLAPMAGVSDIAFRTLCLEQGADLAFTEMVSAKGLSYANEKTRHLLALADGETRVGVQLFGHEPDVMAAQAAWVEDVLGDALAYVDVNMGCPARKIVSKGDGSALMRDPQLAASIVRAANDATSCAVTVKFRRGWAMGSETAPEFARRMEDAGAAAVTVHGRYAEQLYRGSADWGVIARVKRAVSVPVVGNGDIRCGADAVRMRAQTGCDHVMIARGAEGNPWLFSQVKAALAGEVEPAPPDVAQRLRMARRHAELLSQREGRNIVRMRKHAMWYMAGLPGAAAARGRINQCATFEDFNAVFEELLARSRQAS